MARPLAARLAESDRLRTVLERLDDDELLALTPPSEKGKGRTAWGRSGTIEVDGAAAFLKRLPLTADEQARRRATSNGYRIPTFYSYGVGSAGFGAPREAELHRRTTEWVRNGDAAGFPLLHHERVMPRSADGDAEVISPEYLRSWNRSVAIKRYLADRIATTTELWLVLEHVPGVAEPWLQDHQADVDRLLAEVFATTTFLRAQDVVHFDAHLWNVVVDTTGSPLLTDFGLAMAGAFDLTPTERAFLAAHTTYDEALAVACVGILLRERLSTRSEQAIGSVLAAVAERGHPPEQPAGIVRTLVEHVDQLAGPDLLDLDPAIVAAVHRYEAPIKTMNVFLEELRADRSKRVPFDDATMRRQLLDAGVPLTVGHP
jgi:hypothetical protein